MRSSDMRATHFLMGGIIMKEPKENKATENAMVSKLTSVMEETKWLGFRSNVKWKKILSSIYLVICVLYLLTILFVGRENGVGWWDFVVSKIEAIIILVMMLLPYIVLSEGPIRDKLPLFKNRTKTSTVLGAFILCIVCSLVTNLVGGLYTEESYAVSKTSSEVDVEKTSEPSNDVITGINIYSSYVELECGETATYTFEVNGTDDYSVKEDIVFESDDDTVAVIELSDKGNKFYDITGVEPGSATVRIRTTDGTVSKEINVLVKEIEEEDIIVPVPVESEKSEQTATPEPTQEPTSESTQTATPESTPKPTPKPTPESTPKPTPKPTPKQEVNQNNTQGSTVYITPTGKKYHRSASCAGKNAMARNLSDVSGAYGPCKKCAQ